MDLLLEIRRALGTSVLMATHNPAAAAVCDRRLVLSNGTLVGDDAVPPGL